MKIINEINNGINNNVILIMCNGEYGKVMA